MRWQGISRGMLWVVFLITAITSLVRNEVFQGTTNVINWDGYGYYAYLPGAFVYGDIEEYAFAEDHLANYEISSDLYQLMETAEDKRFPIYNIGLAVVWTPAFIITHAITATTGIAPADGMSYPYQLMVVLMSLLFAFLGLLFLKRFLAMFFADLVVALLLLFIGLGTNLFYYTVEAPDMTHGYLFALYAMFLYCFGRGFVFREANGEEGVFRRSGGDKELEQKREAAFFQRSRGGEELEANGEEGVFRRSVGEEELEENKEASIFRRSEENGERKWLIYCGLIAGLLCLIRSSEIVVFAIPAFYGLKNWATLQRNFWRTLPIFCLALAVFSIQLVYYKMGTGHWFQDGYAGLGFDWLSPHFYEGFIGYRRGWLVYTPLMALGLAGIFWLRRPWFLPILIFTIGNCYILFSWHIWWYGDTFGSRPVVQSYAVLALPFGALLTWIMGAAAGAEEGIKEARIEKGKGGTSEKNKGGRKNKLLPFFPLLLMPFIILNLFQHWQYNQRIIPLDFVNKTYYWHVFGKTTLDKQDRVFLDTNEKLPNQDYQQETLLQIDTLVPVPPKARQEFTNLLEHKLTADQVQEDLWLNASVSYTYFGDSFDKWKFPGIVTEHRRGGETLKWVQVNIPRTMTTPAGDDLTFNISLPGAREGDVVKQYVWNLSQDSMVVKAYNGALLKR